MNEARGGGRSVTLGRRITALLVGAALVVFLGGGLAFAEEPAGDLNPLVELLGEVDDAAFQLDLLRGMRQGLVGRRNVPLPPAWSRVYPKLAASENQEVRTVARELALALGDPAAVKSLRELVGDKSAEVEERRAALTALTTHRAAELAELAQPLLAEAPLRTAALRALAACDDPDTPALVLAGYSSWDAAERQEALACLASRVSYARELVKAMEAGSVDPAELSAYTARLLASLGDEAVAEAVGRLWGELRPSSAEKQAAMEQLRAALTEEKLAKADLSRGRALFQTTCAKCHRLFEEGGAIGPDLTGSQRRNLAYLIENVVDPNAQVARGYQMVRLITTEGRVLSGVVAEETPSRVTLVTLEEPIVVPREEIDELLLLPTSLMPEGQYAALGPQEQIDLTAYLMSETQVPLP